MKRVLLLDSSYRPIKQLSWQKAITLYFQDKVEIVEEYEDEWINSPNKKFKMPAIVRLVNYVFRLPWGIRLSRTNIFIRDKGQCQYCEKTLNKGRFTIDHVIPKCKGGNTSWENLVACCARCNSKKGGELLQDTNLKLLKKPTKPKNNMFLIEKENTPQIWLDYIQYFC